MRYAKYGSRYPRPTPLGAGMRVLFAIIGLAALIPVVLIAANEFRALSGGSFVGPLLMLAFSVVVVIGAFLLLRSAFRGTAVVRQPGARKREKGGRGDRSSNA